MAVPRRQAEGRRCPGKGPPIYTPVSFRFALEPLLPKKMHSRSQDKLDKDDPEKDKKEKKKEKRNSKHQEIFDKEFKPADLSPQPSEAVILSETVILRGPSRPLTPLGPALAPRLAKVGFTESAVKEPLEKPRCPYTPPWPTPTLQGAVPWSLSHHILHPRGFGQHPRVPGPPAVSRDAQECRAVRMQCSVPGGPFQTRNHSARGTAEHS